MSYVKHNGEPYYAETWTPYGFGVASKDITKKQMNVHLPEIFSNAVLFYENYIIFNKYNITLGWSRVKIF